MLKNDEDTIQSIVFNNVIPGGLKDIVAWLREMFPKSDITTSPNIDGYYLVVVSGDESALYRKYYDNASMYTNIFIAVMFRHLEEQVINWYGTRGVIENIVFLEHVVSSYESSLKELMEKARNG